MTFWACFYGALAIPTLLLSLMTRRWKPSIAGAIVFFSWLATNTILVTRAPDRFFFGYFAFDAIVAEVMLLMMIHRFRWWMAIFLAATIAQLFVHLAYWGPLMPPRRYHEILNAFYVIQIGATVFEVRRILLGRPDPAPRSVPLPDRPPIRREAPFKVSQLPPEPRGECPAVIRSYS